MANDLVLFNGINGSTGNYLFDPLSPSALSQLAKGERLDRDHVFELKRRHEQSINAHLGVKEGSDPDNLAETGWGVIFTHDADPALRDALGELLDYRREQATGKHPHYYKEYWGETGYRPGESHRRFLARHGVGPGPADPDRVPYYLLIVGDPEAIPYRFQYQLDVQYAVGRIHFETLDEYAQYAHSVVTAERGERKTPRRVTFFATANQNDPATQLSMDYLVKPLVKDLQQDQRFSDWEIRAMLSQEATKATLTSLFLAKNASAICFTASHGMGFAAGDSRQRSHQGALLCQDWPGPVEWSNKRVPQDFYLAADDIDDEARLQGMITFHVACYGAGTPRLDDFAHQALLVDQPAKAPHAFVARLPQRLLGHPRGGALAVIGHVERAWSYSFAWPGVGSQTLIFQDLLKLLMQGSRAGHAFEIFNERYAELAADLSSELEEIRFGKIVDDLEVAAMWAANNDSRNYVIIGDPAVRLRVQNAPVEQRL